MVWMNHPIGSSDVEEATDRSDDPLGVRRVAGVAGGHAARRRGHQSDNMFGGPGTDTMYGAGGKDTLFGEGGDDSLSGGDNTDYLDGGPGVDVANGGRGRDRPLVEPRVRPGNGQYVDGSGCVAETILNCQAS